LGEQSKGAIRSVSSGFPGTVKRENRRLKGNGKKGSAVKKIWQSGVRESGRLGGGSIEVKQSECLSQLPADWEEFAPSNGLGLNPRHT